jgi:cell division protein FtsI (penicillin-binding protein 3)
MSSDRASTAHRNRLIVLALGFTFGFAVILAQLVNYQVVQHAKLKELAEIERLRERDITPARGDILDALGQVLALNSVQWDISVSPSLVADREQLADQLSEQLGLPREEIAARLAVTDVLWIPIEQYVAQQAGENLLALEASGLICQPRPKRVYPDGSLLAHTLGIVTMVGDGFYGVEGYYNQALKGSEGKEEIEHDSRGAPLPVPPLGQSPPRKGVSVVLTLDSHIQYIAKQELLRALDEYDAEAGTVIVMDPRTGAILANFSYPTYDPNDFASTDMSLLSDPAVSKMWEPGSVFKIVTWAIGLDTGTISPGTTFYDDGTMEVGGRVIENWDRQGHGLVTMTDGLVESLNTVAAFVSTSVGKDQFYTYLRRFGFGSLTNVDLASEGPGMVKQPGDSNWFPSDLGTNSFGQGIAVTPIQMIAAAAAVANRGVLMKPYIVQQYITEEAGAQRVVNVEPTIVRHAITEETALTLTDMLEEVIDQEATKAMVPGYHIAGKTGTAEVPTAYGYDPEDTIASFVGFAPADDPRFIVLVKLDKPRESPWGTQTAAPTFQAIAERLFVYMHVPPDDVRLAQQAAGQ